jgi:hypothetical protein
MPKIPAQSAAARGAAGTADRTTKLLQDMRMRVASIGSCRGCLLVAPGSAVRDIIFALGLLASWRINDLDDMRAVVADARPNALVRRT